VVKTVGLKGDGIEKLAMELDNHWVYLMESGQLAVRRQGRLRRELLDRVKGQLELLCQNLVSPAEMNSIVQNMADGQIDPYSQAKEIVSRLGPHRHCKEGNND
jgi:LAO/AO transport system kinase